METKRITFDELPVIMLDLINKIDMLSDKVENLAQRQSEQNRVLEKKTAHRPMKTAEVCAYLHLTPVSIYRLVAGSRIPYYKQGRQLLFYEDEIYAWVKSGRKMGADSITDYAQAYCISNII